MYKRTSSSFTHSGVVNFWFDVIYLPYLLDLTITNSRYCWGNWHPKKYLHLPISFSRWNQRKNVRIPVLFLSFEMCFSISSTHRIRNDIFNPLLSNIKLVFRWSYPMTFITSGLWFLAIFSLANITKVVQIGQLLVQIPLFPFHFSTNNI